MTTANSAIFNPTDLVLELDQATIDRAWSLSQTAGNPTSRWQNYLNQAALAVFLPWLQAELDNSAKVEGEAWELINGTAIATKGAKLVLIPSEAEDLSELRVSQEWIDIPSWTADYYLAVQVNVDAGYVRIWGYTTHQNLKQGDFDRRDRTYSLTDDQLISDLNVLWVARELCLDEVTQAAVEPIAELETTQVDSLVERLGNQNQLLPRLAVPFASWAALLQNPQLCQRLIAARRGEPAKTPILKWLKQGLSEISSELGWRQLEISLEGSKGNDTLPNSGLAKKLTIANRPYELKILPLTEAGEWRFELCCLTPGCTIPEGFKLKLLTADLKNFEGNEDVASQAVNQLTIDVDLEPGESLVWQVEPNPDNYQQEILQF